MKYTARYLCCPGSRLDDNPSDLMAAIEAYDPREIAEFLRGLAYKDFLRTPYWAAVVVAKKRQARWKCERCEEKRELQVHHKNYKHRCLEHINLTSLECLCRVCHAKEHGKQTWSMPPTLKQRFDAHKKKNVYHHEFYHDWNVPKTYIKIPE